jgi:hypothetical protein
MICYFVPVAASDSNTTNTITPPTPMTTTKIKSDEGIKGLAIEINGRGADFYADGSFYAWQGGDEMFNRCEATNNLTAYVSRNALKECIAAAEKELGATFDVGDIGVYVDEEGNVDPHNEIA